MRHLCLVSMVKRDLVFSREKYFEKMYAKLNTFMVNITTEDLFEVQKLHVLSRQRRNLQSLTFKKKNSILLLTEHGEK